MSGAITTAGLDPGTQLELDAAMAELRSGGNTVVRLADLLGKFLGRAGDSMLRRVGLNITHPAFTPIAQMALDRAYDAAILGIDMPGSQRASLPAVALSGFVGGFAGLAGFLPDAVFTTLVIMRDIVRIAREEGEDLSTEEGRAACVRVFSLGVGGDEAGYISARLMLEGSAARAMLSGVAVRWGSVLGEKFAAQALPLAGAAAAVALNTAFLEHYRRLARAHFTIRRLERAHGRERVRAAAGIVENPEEDAPFVAT